MRQRLRAVFGRAAHIAKIFAAIGLAVGAVAAAVAAAVGLRGGAIFAAGDFAIAAAGILVILFAVYSDPAGDAADPIGGDVNISGAWWMGRNLQGDDTYRSIERQDDLLFFGGVVLLGVAALPFLLVVLFG